MRKMFQVLKTWNILRKKLLFRDCIFEPYCSYFCEIQNDSMKTAYTEEQIKLARFAKAFGHPARIKILEILSKQDCCYSGNIAEEFPIALSTLSQHLKELKDSGLIQGEIEAPRIRYCINSENWLLARQLMDDFLQTASEPKAITCK
jgi:ArsR family transcriptional regulator, arsenate/arsenite/antimonite-responsive transcriptional repressor